MHEPFRLAAPCRLAVARLPDGFFEERLDPHSQRHGVLAEVDAGTESVQHLLRDLFEVGRVAATKPLGEQRLRRRTHGAKQGVFGRHGGALW